MSTDLEKKKNKKKHVTNIKYACFNFLIYEIKKYYIQRGTQNLNNFFFIFKTLFVIYLCYVHIFISIISPKHFYLLLFISIN